jgi:hypothetical protein
MCLLRHPEVAYPFSLDLMTSRFVIAILSLVLLGSALPAEPPSRMLMHTYQSEGILVNISFIDLPSGPVCHIDDGRVSSASLKVRDLTISKEQFDHLWSVATSHELAPFEHKKDSSAPMDALNSYVFTAQTPDGETKVFVVPKQRAPKLVVELVREIRAYGRD